MNKSTGYRHEWGSTEAIAVTGEIKRPISESHLNRLSLKYVKEAVHSGIRQREMSHHANT